MAAESREMGGMLWVTCAAGQLASALLLYRKGHGASAMPFRAFYIVSLGLGSAACCAGAALHTAGIRRLEDVKDIGKSIKRSMNRAFINEADSQRSR